jgi:hypothetical protein
MPASFAYSRTTHQTAFLLSRLPHTRPVLLTQRKIIPVSIPAMASHESIAPFTHAGTGTVRTCPPFPNRSMIAQWSSRC